MHSKTDDLLVEVRSAAAAGVFSADTVACYFHEQGIGREAITGEHLLPLYAGIETIPQSPGQSCTGPLPLEIKESLGQGAVCAIILETREHPALEPVVLAFARQLRIPVFVFHGTGNESFIRESVIADLAGQEKVRLCRMAVSKLSAKQYNAIFMNRDFWKWLAGYKKVLVFQTDTLLCPASPYSLKDFLSFDYIGSTWTSGRPIRMRIRGGSGGLSLRGSEAQLNCMERFPPEYWPGGEDAYFAFHLDLMGYRVATEEQCACFSTQQRFEEWSFGVHKPRLLGEEEQKKFLEYCPEASLLI